MNPKTTRKLARRLNRPPAATRHSPTGPWIVGTVTAVNLSTTSLTVTIHGDTTAIPGISFLESYTPIVGDTCVLVRNGAHLWAVGAIANNYSVQPALMLGAGADVNYITGGANRTNTWPFLWTASVVVTTTTGGGWSYTTGGLTFNGCGNVHVTPGDHTNGLLMLSVIDANCSISGGNLTLAGAAYNGSVSTSTGNQLGLGSGLAVRINITAVGW